MKIIRHCLLMVTALIVSAVPLRTAWSMTEGSVTQPYPEEIRREACVECHSETEIKAVTDRGAELQLHVSEHKFERSVHGNMECVTCHAPKADAEDFADTPHNIQHETLPSCMNCHSQTFDYVRHQIKESKHFETQGNNISCIDCHNPHTQQSVTAMDSYQDSVADSNKVCTDCHTSAIRYKELTGKAVYTQDLSHEFLPARDQHFASVRCVECHTPAEGNTQEHMILAKEESVRECEACHTEEDSLLVARIKSHTDVNQGGGAFVGKGYFDDAELIERMNKADINTNEPAPIVRREVPDEEVAKAFEDAYVPGTGQKTGWESRVTLFLSLVLAVLFIHGALRLFLSHKSEEGDRQGERIYPTPVRVLHTTNAILFILLLATGFSVHYADSAFSLPMEFSNDVHTIAGLLLIINFAAFLLFSLLTGDIVQYLPFKKGGMEKFRQQLHYYAIGIFRGEEKPHHATVKQRLNPVQQLTYLVVYVLGMFVLLISGMLLLVPELAEAYLPAVTTRSLATVHYLLAIGYLAFLLLHLYMITTGKKPTSLLKGMATGHHYD